PAADGGGGGGARSPPAAKVGRFPGAPPPPGAAASRPARRPLRPAGTTGSSQRGDPSLRPLSLTAAPAYCGSGRRQNLPDCTALRAPALPAQRILREGRAERAHGARRLSAGEFEGA